MLIEGYSRIEAVTFGVKNMHFDIPEFGLESRLVFSCTRKNKHVILLSILFLYRVNYFSIQYTKTFNEVV